MEENKVSDKPYEQKTVVERHTTPEGKFNLSSALNEQDMKIKALQEAVAFFADWYNKMTTEPGKAHILVPETKIIMP